jgi:hypothetical protein
MYHATYHVNKDKYPKQYCLHHITDGSIQHTMHVSVLSYPYLCHYMQCVNQMFHKALSSHTTAASKAPYGKTVASKCTLRADDFSLTESHLSCSGRSYQ